MDEKSLWIGIGVGLVSAGITFLLLIQNNNYVDMLPKSMFVSTSAIVPYYINLQTASFGLLYLGAIIAIGFWLKRDV